MATKKVIRFRFQTTGGDKTFTLNAEPINDTLTDPDSGDSLYPAAIATIKQAWEGDNGETITAVSIDIITTVTNSIVENYSE